ncbi:MAG: 7-cyano-7-deazaguanine synthase QueC [Phycisphaerales bacterium]|jgi:7-cyano-7-deazaguanine synthase|nr:7-cyano-7-deazaguanine synthase QueC [Phycisphaerales bacterium]
MNENDEKRAVVLLSGGLDSATVLAIARDMGFDCHAISFDYGQRHDVELAASDAVAEAFGVVEHRTVKIDLSAAGGFGHSALTDDIDVPMDRPSDEAIPETYVPARNTIFLSIALGFAEVLDARDIFIGVNAVDYSGYPDCRPEFIEAFEKLANLATAAGVEGSRPFVIHAPLVNMTKAQIITRGVELGVDYGITHSCYSPAPDGAACGHCDSCRLRAAGFETAGLPDPTRYAL